MSKQCPTCQRSYADPELVYCLDDGTALTGTFDSEATVVNPQDLGVDPEPGAAGVEPVNSEATVVNPQDLGFVAEPGAAAAEPFNSEATVVNPQDLGAIAEPDAAAAEPFNSEATVVNPILSEIDPDATQVRGTARRPPEPTLVMTPAPTPSDLRRPARSGIGGISNNIGVLAGGVLLAIIMVGVVVAVGVVWLMQGSQNITEPNKNRGSETPGGTPTATPANTPSETPTPSPTPVTRTPVAVSGRWTGTWKNSKGDGGSSTIAVFEAANGAITGGEGPAWIMVNGRRNGNVLTWEYRDVGDGCMNYQCRFEVDDAGNKGHGTYTVQDHCEDENFTGWYLDFTKQ